VPAPPIPNAPPVFDGAPPHSVNEGESVDIDIAAYFSDPDDPALAFGTRALPGWLALSGSRITGIPPGDTVGPTVSFVVTATDPDGASAEGERSEERRVGKGCAWR